MRHAPTDDRQIQVLSSSDGWCSQPKVPEGKPEVRGATRAASHESSDHILGRTMANPTEAMSFSVLCNYKTRQIGSKPELARTLQHNVVNVALVA